MKNNFPTFDLIDCRLIKNRIDIWEYPLGGNSDRFYPLLDANEQSRAQRYHFAKHRRRFTIARATLRLILSRYLSASPLNLSFHYNAQGKPYLQHPCSLEFNISHSEDRALVAVGKTYPLGIDLEFFSERPYEGIGKHLFSARENQALQQTLPPIKPLIFFHIWSQKEAFIKACGLGLSYPTEQFDVPIVTGKPQPVFDALHEKTWNILSFMPQVACHAALCYDPSITEIRYKTLRDPEVLLSYENI